MSAREALARSLEEAILASGGMTYDEAADALLPRLAAAGYTILGPDENHGPTLERAADADDAETKMAVAALVALAERGVPTDVQELLVRGDPMRGIAPGALSAAFAAAIRAMGEKK